MRQRVWHLNNRLRLAGLALCALMVLSWVGCDTQTVNSVGGTGSPTAPSDPTTPPTVSADLPELINQYRRANGLAPIPIASALSLVARTHVIDLYEHRPDQGPCNAHSWSKQGTWTACCYTGDHAQASCMWNKPRELTAYVGDGYEIVAWSSADITPEQALAGWRSSPPHNSVILNLNTWQDVTWRAMGSAYHRNYASVWFGKEPER
jgi:hypothetical protein